MTIEQFNNHYELLFRPGPNASCDVEVLIKHQLTDLLISTGIVASSKEMGEALFFQHYLMKLKN